MRQLPIFFASRVALLLAAAALSSSAAAQAGVKAAGTSATRETDSAVTREQILTMSVEVRELAVAAGRRERQMAADRRRLEQRASRLAGLPAVHARLRAIQDRKGITGLGYLIPLYEIDSVLRDKFANSRWGQDGGDAAVSALDDFSRVLKARGIGLFVVVVPPRIEVRAAELFPGVSREEIVWPEYTRVLIKLLQAGVEVVDVLDAMKEYRGDMDLYCPADVHWGPGGIETAARMLADRMFSRYRFVTQWERTERFFSCATAVIPSPTSTVVLNAEELGREDEELFALDFPPLPIYQVRLLGQVCPAPRSARSPVLVTGDSTGFYLQPHGGSFSQHLSQALGFLVNDFCVAGGLHGSPARCIKEDLPEASDTRLVVLITDSSNLSRMGDAWKLASRAVSP